MGRSRERQVYRVRQLPLHLESRRDIAPFLAGIAPDLGVADNIRVFSLAQEKDNSKTATIAFKAIPSIFDNDQQQWTLQAEVLCGRNFIVDTHFRGFTILNEPRSSSHSMDCVAISGLASHPFGSWKHRQPGSDFMWLRDGLPQDVPKLRSLIYGYDTKLFKSRSFQDLDDIARSFIASLKELRRTLLPAKPLVFLAHSLGGIVLKRAIVLLAHDGNNEEKMISESVRGLVFFGVPHRGMKIDHFLAMVAKQPNEDLISSTLSPKSALLPELDEQFSKIAMDINQNIRFVYETKESQLTEKTLSETWVRSESSHAVLVTKDSAIPPGTHPRHTIAVDEDHSNMVKFGEGDDTYQQVKSFLLDLSQDTDSRTSDHNIWTPSPALQTSPPNTRDMTIGCIVNPTLATPDQKRHKTIWTVPFPKDPSFVGREDILAQLDSEFANPKSQGWASLYGLGGIGKSQIAIEYSYRHKERSSQISTFWIHASSKARFEQSFVQVAMTVKIPGSEDGKVDIFQMVSNWLANQDNGPWLLILDNADDTTVLLEPSANDTGARTMPVQRCLLDLLPRVRHGAVLITTRDRSCALSLTGYRGTPVEVLSMSLNESVELLQTWLPEACQKEASELVEELENVPLAISQAGAYIKEVPRISIPKYLAIFRRSSEDQVTLLNKNKKDLRRDPEMPNAVITSWELSFDQIRENSPRSAELLSLMSYFNRQAIPKILIEEDLDELSFEEDINLLLSFSLVRKELGKDSFEVHRLIQTAVQYWLRCEGYEELWKERAIERVAHRFPIAYNQGQHWPICETLMSHADEVILYTASSEVSELNRAEILVNTACYLTERKGHNMLAEQRSRHALRIRQRYEDKDSDIVLHTLEVLAESQRGAYKYEEAARLREFILKRRLKSGGPEHSKSLVAMYSLASLHCETGQYEKAEDLLKRVIEVQINSLSPEDPGVLSSENELVTVYLGLRKYEEAEKLSAKNLETSIRCLGVEHINTLVAMRKLVVAYSGQNKFEEAEDLMAEAIPSFTRILGPSHWRTLDIRCCLAEIYYRQKKLDDAKKICISCLEILQEFYGLQHHTTFRINDLLGRIYRDQKEFVDASRLLRDTVERSTELLGATDPDTLVSMFNLALCYDDMGDKVSAIRLMTEVVEKRRKVLPASHPDIIHCAESLANLKSEEEKRGKLDSREEEWETEGEEGEEEESEEEKSGEEEWETAEEENEEEKSEEDGSVREGLAKTQISPPEEAEST